MISSPFQTLWKSIDRGGRVSFPQEARLAEVVSHFVRIGDLSTLHVNRCCNPLFCVVLYLGAWCAKVVSMKNQFRKHARALGYPTSPDVTRREAYQIICAAQAKLRAEAPECPDYHVDAKPPENDTWGAYADWVWSLRDFRGDWN